MSDLDFELVDIKGPRAEFTSKREEPLNVTFVSINSVNWSDYLPDKKFDKDSMDKLKEGDYYMRVAVDSKSNNQVVGLVEVRRWENNTLSVKVEPEYWRKTVGEQLIKQAQQDHDKLQLMVSGGEAAKKLFDKMGFRDDGEGVDRMVWSKSK